MDGSLELGPGFRSRKSVAIGRAADAGQPSGGEAPSHIGSCPEARSLKPGARSWSPSLEPHAGAWSLIW
jgi:hypothetical protein